MSFFRDALSVFKKRDLTFLDSYQEVEGVYTFLFKKEDDLNWKAGQYGLFTITHKKIKNPTKPFTIASAPHENVVRITTRISHHPSDFKQALLDLTPGMQIRIAGPVGSFYLKENQPTLLIAGGMGITPFRSILNEIEVEGNRDRKNINLLYMNSEKTFLFQGEFARKEFVHVEYLDSRDDLHLQIDEFINIHDNKGKYLVAGSKSMVDSVSTYIKNKNISKRNIKSDYFYGY